MRAPHIELAYLPDARSPASERADGKAMLLCLVTKDLTNRYHAGNIIKAVAPLVGGSGGGRPDMAQAGGQKPEHLEAALEKLPEIL